MHFVIEIAAKGNGPNYLQWAVKNGKVKELKPKAMKLIIFLMNISVFLKIRLSAISKYLFFY